MRAVVRVAAPGPGRPRPLAHLPHPGASPHPSASPGLPDLASRFEHRCQGPPRAPARPLADCQHQCTCLKQWVAVGNAFHGLIRTGGRRGSSSPGAPSLPRGWGLTAAGDVPG